MKYFLTFLTAIFAALFSLPAIAAGDLTTSIVVKQGANVIYEQTNHFIGMTAEEETALQKRGMATLNFASKMQDKGGDYTIVWKWGDSPAIETPGMKFASVNQVLRQGTRWLGDTIATSEAKASSGKSRPWGK